jgi:hypothetical protein
MKERFLQIVKNKPAIGTNLTLVFPASNNNHEGCININGGGSANICVVTLIEQIHHV